jgi:hypothetical protein
LTLDIEFSKQLLIFDLNAIKFCDYGGDCGRCVGRPLFYSVDDSCPVFGQGSRCVYMIPPAAAELEIQINIIESGIKVSLLKALG